MKRLILLLATALLFAGAGCEPEKRVSWSPDGRWAAVVGSDGFYLTDASGRLSPRLLPTARRAVWMPDGRSVLVVSEGKLSTWAQAATILDESHQKDVIQRAAATLAEVENFTGNVAEFRPHSLDTLSDGEKAAVLLYLREHSDGILRAKFGATWDEIAAADVTIWEVHQVTVPAMKLDSSRVLLRSFDDIMTPKVSPDGKLIAYTAMTSHDSKEPTIGVFVAPLTGNTPPRLVALDCAPTAAWSPDSRTLYFVFQQPSGNSPSGFSIGMISAKSIVDERGDMLAQFADQPGLVGLLFSAGMKIECLRDGRLLFATIETQLPSVTQDMPQQLTLFSFDPMRGPALTRLITRSAEREVGDGVGYFEVSPDEKHVAFPSSSGDIVIYSLSTGDCWTITPPVDARAENRKVFILPSWRSSDELTFARIPDKNSADQRATVMLARINWSAHDVRMSPLSDSWSAESVQDFLMGKQPETQPATAVSDESANGSAPP